MYMRGYNGSNHVLSNRTVCTFFCLVYCRFRGKTIPFVSQIPARALNYLLAELKFEIAFLSASEHISY